MDFLPLIFPSEMPVCVSKVTVELIRYTSRELDGSFFEEFSLDIKASVGRGNVHKIFELDELLTF
jgi:hypothetical protein